jgi:hypothetical protein
MVHRLRNRVPYQAAAAAVNIILPLSRLETIVRRSTTLTKFLVAFLAVAMLFTAISIPKPANAQSIGISVSFGPPPIPYYVQPPNPDPNYIWSPGYWGYDPDDGYYWVPGTWVPAPQYGLYWTPGYWAWNGIAFIFSSGYWAPQVGWYGGVNYGYGYYGNGYSGGRWHGHQFAYNTAISNVNRSHVRDVYSDPGAAQHTWNRVSYNGGRGGVSARPSANQLAVRDHRASGPTNVQMQHARFAATNRANFSAVNHGRPATAAMVRPYSRPMTASRPMNAARPMSAARPMTAGRPEAQHGTAPQHATAMQEHRAAPVQHAYAPQHAAAPVQHAYAQHAAQVQHSYVAPAHHAYAASMQHAAPVQHYAAPVQHSYAAPVQRAAPVQHYAAPAQHAYAPAMQRSAPQMQRSAPQMQRAAPAMHAAPAAPRAAGPARPAQDDKNHG